MNIKLIGLVACLALSLNCYSVTTPTTAPIVRRIHIKHADPMLIAILLSGKQHWNQQPEISTIIKT